MFVRNAKPCFSSYARPVNFMPIDFFTLNIPKQKAFLFFQTVISKKKKKKKKNKLKTKQKMGKYSILFFE